MNTTSKTEKQALVSAHIYTSLLASLREGKWNKGEKLPSERQLAEELSCSRVSIRSAPKHLAEQKLILRKHGAGTFVVGGALMHHWRRIGLVLHESIAEPVIGFYSNQILIGFLRSCDQYDFSASLITLKDQETLVDAIPRLDLELSSYDAIILVDSQLQPEEQKLLEACHCCYVALTHGENANVSCIDINNFHGGYLASKHLLESGRRHPVVITESMHKPYIGPRIDGIVKAFREFHLDFQLEQRFFPDVVEETQAENLVDRLLDEQIPLDSMIVGGDWAMVGVIRKLRKRKIRIPEDVALVMYDDYEWVSRSMNLPLTVIRQPFAEQISIAVRMVAEKLDGRGGDRVRVHVIQPELIIRESSGKKSSPSRNIIENKT